MKEEQFDDLSRILGATTSRRQGLKALIAAAGGLFGFTNAGKSRWQLAQPAQAQEVPPSGGLRIAQVGQGPERALIGQANSHDAFATLRQYLVQSGYRPTPPTVYQLLEGDTALMSVVPVWFSSRTQSKAAYLAFITVPGADAFAFAAVFDATGMPDHVLYVDNDGKVVAATQSDLEASIGSAISSPSSPTSLAARLDIVDPRTCKFCIDQCEASQSTFALECELIFTALCFLYALVQGSPIQGLLCWLLSKIACESIEQSLTPCTDMCEQVCDFNDDGCSPPCDFGQVCCNGVCISANDPCPITIQCPDGQVIVVPAPPPGKDPEFYKDQWCACMRGCPDICCLGNPEIYGEGTPICAIFAFQCVS